MNDKPRNLCATCGSNSTMKCSGCRCVYYCSVLHQKEDWKKHKQVCMKGSSIKYNKQTGAPLDKYIPQEWKAALHVNGITKLQQDLMRDRMNEFFAGLDGTFTVVSNNINIDGNNIPDCSQIRINWRNTRNDAGIQNSSGERNILFLSSQSLVMELHAMNLKSVDEHYKYLEGGFLYLIGEPHLFWSLMIHRKSTSGQLCFPPPIVNPEKPWADDSWAVRELERIGNPIINRTTNTGISNSPLQIKIASRSLSTIAILNKNEAFNDVLLSLSSSSSIAAPSMTVATLPKWWSDCEQLWGGVLARVTGNKPPCMFYCTPVGCGAGVGCVGSHDQQWKAAIETIKRRKL